MTNDEDRKAFEAACKKAGLPTRMRNGSYAEHDTRHFLSGYLAARDHYRQEVQELVEAVLATGGFLHREDDGCFSCTINFEQLDNACRLAAKLKGQQDNE